MPAIRRAVRLSFAAAASLTLVGAVPAVALGFSYTDTIQGCQPYSVPSGNTTINITAVGANGYQLGAGTPGSGGNVAGQATVSDGQQLYVCVNSGGGAAGQNGGAGGGASGVSLGSDFSSPLIVGGGGGGNGAGGWSAGNAGLPAGATGNGWAGFGGYGGTQSAPGAGGINTFGGASGQAGSGSSATGPGTGGAGGSAGGGGGGGYYGAGSGAANTGGGGGSDYCAGSISNCSATLASSGPSVTIWTLTSQTISFPATPVSYGQSDLSPASASSGLTITYSNLSGDCSIDGSGLIQITGAGSCTATASQSGNSGYQAAGSVTQTFAIDPATIHLDASPAVGSYGQPDPATSGTLRAGDFQNGDTSAVVSGSASCSIASHSANAGTYPGVVSCSRGTLSAANYTFASGSAASLTIPARAPDTSALAVTGTLVVGHTLTVEGQQPAVSYTYQWSDCNSLTLNCQVIAGATAAGYALSGVDVGDSILVLVDVSDGGGSMQVPLELAGTIAPAETVTPTAPVTTPVPVTPVSPAAPAAVQVSWSAPTSRSGSTLDSGSLVSCPSGGPECSVSALATVTLGGASGAELRAEMAQTVTIGQTSFSVAAGQSAHALIHLNQIGLKLLSDHKQLPVEIRLSGGPAGSEPVTTVKTVLLNGSTPRVKLGRLFAYRDGSITVRAHVSGAGRVEVMVSAWDDNIAASARNNVAPAARSRFNRKTTGGPGHLRAATNRFVVASTAVTVRHSGIVTLHLAPTARGRRLIAHPRYRVTLRLWVGYRPPYAAQAKVGIRGLHL